MKTKHYIIILIAVGMLMSLAPVILPKAVWIGGTSAIDTTRVRGHFRADSTFRLTKYQTSDTNKVFGISSTGYITMRTKVNATPTLQQITTSGRTTTDSIVQYNNLWSLTSFTNLRRITNSYFGAGFTSCGTAVTAGSFQIAGFGYQYNTGLGFLFIGSETGNKSCVIMPATTFSTNSTVTIRDGGGDMAFTSDFSTLVASGTAVLVAGTVTVTDANCLSGSEITVTYKTPNTAIGTLVAVAANGSFTITSYASLGVVQVTDVSTVQYIRRQ